MRLYYVRLGFPKEIDLPESRYTWFSKTYQITFEVASFYAQSGLINYLKFPLGFYKPECMTSSRSEAGRFALQAVNHNVYNSVSTLPCWVGILLAQDPETYADEPRSSTSILYLTSSIAVCYYLCIRYCHVGFINAQPTRKDYQETYNEIANRLEEDYHYDDGSYGPILVRLAWHASGTYDEKMGTGGSNGATMRFAPESDHGANAGLDIARNFLEPVKSKSQNDSFEFWVHRLAISLIFTMC